MVVIIYTAWTTWMFYMEDMRFKKFIRIYNSERELISMDKRWSHNSSTYMLIFLYTKKQLLCLRFGEQDTRIISLHKVYGPMKCRLHLFMQFRLLDRIVSCSLTWISRKSRVQTTQWTLITLNSDVIEVIFILSFADSFPDLFIL